MSTPLYTVGPLYSNTEDTSIYSGTPLFQYWTPLYTVEPNTEDTSVYSGTPLFQSPEMKTPLYTVKHLYSNVHLEMRTPLYTVKPLYSNTLKWGHLCIQWSPSIPTPWNEDTSVYSEAPLFQHPEMRTPLYTVKPLYSNTLKWGFLSSISTKLWNPLHTN